MKSKQFTIFRKVVLLIFVLIATLSLLFISITYLATTHFYQEGTQLLNKDVASHIAKFTSPFGPEGIDKKKADSVFYNAMVISPSAEVYFLDTSGNVIAFHTNDHAVQLWNIPLQNIKEHIASNGKSYIKSADPRDPEHPKIFSAAEVINKNVRQGYIYVVLGNNEYRNVSAILFNSHIGQLVVEAFGIIILSSLIVSLWYLYHLRKSFSRMTGVLARFEAGDMTARFEILKHNELTPVTTAFNKLADLLVYHIERLKRSEAERNSFIANISHDLRTPLAVARGYAETMQIEGLNTTVEVQRRDEYLSLVLGKIRQVEKMVDQLLDLSKMETAEFKPRKEAFVFSEVLLELIGTAKLSLSAKFLDIHCNHCQDSGWIYADIGMMERVIQNLLYNAIQHTPERGKITISLDKRSEDLIFRIGNDGKRLPDELLAWINSKDVQTISSRTNYAGLGLVIVRKILHLHAFTIEAESPQSGGAIFTVRMSLHLVKAAV